jgi:GH24 family phage-related lysozyme (muramidase)
MGEARVDMVLTSIPLYNKDGVGELLTDSTVIPIEMKNGRSFINPVNGQSMSFFSDIKDESGAIDIYGPASDFNVWANSLQSGTNPNQIKLTTSPKTVQNQIDYFVAPKTKDELVVEIKDSLLKTPNRNTSKDSIFVGQDSSMDTIAEFRMALQSEMPFLVKNAQQNMGLNQQQAVELYSALLTDETSAALFEKAKGKQFIVTLADVTLSTKQFLNNAQTSVPNLPPIDSSNNDILKGIQDRITITPTKLMAQAIEQADIKKQETTPQTKMEWNYDTLSWEKVPVVKEQTFTSDPNFKYGGAIGMIRDFFTGEKTQKETSPGSVGEKPYINLISEFEGMKTEAYWDDTGKVWTIGKGTTTYRDGTPVKKGDKISKEEADNLMQDFVDTKIIPRLSETIPTWNEMNPNQQAALISFAYNMKNGQNFYGRKGFETLTKAVSSVDNFKDVPTALLLYNKTGGKKSKGLARRRKAEADLWSK